MPYIVIGGVLYHYGIPGMRWGKRRFQNKDGSLTEAGKRRYAKSIQRYAKIQGHKSAARAVAQDIASDKVLRTVENDVERASSALSRWRSLSKVQDDFYGDAAYREAYRKTYDDTLKWFKDHEPEELAELIRSNGGSQDGLDAYNSFNDAMDHRTYIHPAQQKWNFDHHVPDSRVDSAYREYSNACHQITEQLVGLYGDRKVTSTNFGWGNVDVNDVVDTAARLVMDTPLDELRKDN